MSAVNEFTEVNFIISHGIYTYENLKIQNAKRKSIVKKLQLGKVTKEEFMNILDEELRLLVSCRTVINNESIKLKKENTNDILTRNNNMLFCMSIHINRLFSSMFKKFPICYDLLSKYIKFCLNNKMFYSHCKRTLNKLAFNHHNDPRIYILAARFIFHELCDIQKARQYFDEGLKFHHECKQLHLEKFFLEAIYMKRTSFHLQTTVQNYYRQLIVLFQGDMEFHFKLLLKILQRHHFLDLHNEVFMNIYQEHKCNPYMWQTMTKIILKGYIFNFESISLTYSSQQQCKIKGIIDTYAQGFTQKLSTKNQQHLRILYIDDLMKIYKSKYMDDEETNKLMQTTLKNLFRDVHVNNAFNCIGYYLYWVKHTNNIDELWRSFDIIKEKIVFWKSTLVNYMKNDINYKTINDAYFYCAPSALDSNFSLAYIIQIYMQHHNDPDMLNVFKKHKYCSNPNIFSLSKPSEYLELCDGEYAGIDEIMKFTNDLKLQYPQFNDLYKNVIRFKNNFNKYKIGTVLKFSELICIDFGYNNIDLWIDYIQFVYEYCRNERLAKTIFQTASKHINPNLCYKLAYKFNKLQNHYMYNTCISLKDD